MRETHMHGQICMNTHARMHAYAVKREVHIRPVVKRYSRWLSPYHLFLVLLDHVQSIDVKHLVGIHGDQDTARIRLKTSRSLSVRGFAKKKKSKNPEVGG